MAATKILTSTKIVNNKQVSLPGTNYEKTVVVGGKVIPLSQSREEGISSNCGPII